MAKSWTKDEVLTKVRGLLDKADSTPFEAEADSARQLADDLMFKYAVESFEIEQSRDRAKAREEPEMYRFEICQKDSPIREELCDLFFTVANHCRCEAVTYGRGGRTKSSSGRVVFRIQGGVVGFPADVKYAEMLFLSLRLQLGSHVEPKLDPTLSREENIVVLLDSGQTRRRVAELLGESYEKKHSEYSKLYRLHLEKSGQYVPRSGQTGGSNRPSPRSYFRSFAGAFHHRVAMRLYEMRQRQTTNAGESVAIVLSDRNIEVHNKFEEVFGKVRTYREKAAERFVGSAARRGDEEGTRARLTVERDLDFGSRPLPA